MLDVCTSVIIVSLIGQIGEKAFDYLLHKQIHLKLKSRGGFCYPDGSRKTDYF